METNKARVLAYDLAKELNPKDLAEVSGGEASWGLSQKACGGPTGSDVKSLDAQIDVSIDW